MPMNFAGLLAPRKPTGGLLGDGGMFGGLFNASQAEPNLALWAVAQQIGGNKNALGQVAPLIAQQRQGNITKRWLMSKGLSEDEANVYAANPTLLAGMIKTKDNWMSAGDGTMFNTDTGEFKTGPNAHTKAPDMAELFDENGRPYKAQWDAQAGKWVKLGGSKPTGTTEQVNRNRQLFSVVEPEVKNLIGDGTAPGKFDALAGLGNQAGDIAGGIGKSLGVDLSGFTTSPDYQSAKNSLKTIVASYLYSVSGATATPGEVENLSSTLMPRPGEAEASVAQKKQRVQTMVDAVRQAAFPEGASGGGAPSPDMGGYKILSVE